jgi:hypothetical protein
VRPKGVADGHQVNIPEQPNFRQNEIFQVRGYVMRLRSICREFNEKYLVSTGVTHQVNVGVLMNSRASSKFML